jgi:hypothetical protein
MNILARWFSLIRAMHGNNGPNFGSDSNTLAASAPKVIMTGTPDLGRKTSSDHPQSPLHL